MPVFSGGRPLFRACALLFFMLLPPGASLAGDASSPAAAEWKLPGLWSAYYPASSDSSPETASSLLASWLFSIQERRTSAYPQGSGEWLDFGRSLGLSLAILGGLGGFILRRTRRLPPPWDGACRRILLNFWPPFGLGLAVLSASAAPRGGQYDLCVLLYSLLLIAATAGLSWRLRLLSLAEREKRFSPLKFLYPVVATGLCLLFLDPPFRILGLLWGLALLVFLCALLFLRRSLRRASFFLPELFALDCSAFFALASLFLVVAGYDRLSILLFPALFVLINIIMLGTALTGLLRLGKDRLMSLCGERPMRGALAQTAGIPLAWILSSLCLLPWLKAVPGASGFLRDFLGAGFNAGGVRLDFSSFLLITLLFFLFRAFIGLGRTSLEHLPEKFPQIERGVIPPLRSMLGGVLWFFFILAALGLLGVNLTSLAVVAGGLSVGLGFGLQNICNNMVSGLMLIFERNILVGDYVNIGNVSGTVRAINIRSTTVETSERALVYVPNSVIMSGQFSNWTRGDRRVRCSLEVKVAQGSDTALTAKIILESAAGHPRVLENPAPGVYFSEFGKGFLGFTLYMHIDDFDYSARVQSDLRFDLEKALAGQGIALF
ncbi:MAG: mechanosensitive ion channel [Deltaproteobacteria bacterium]|nr:mechanosensitive ion channel [Deltaproteobacteria bacterium]